LSWTSAVLRNCSGKNADCPRVFLLNTFYRWRGGVRGPPGGPHHPLAWPGGGRHPLVSLPSAPPLALFWSSSFIQEK
jgi:hypothetical protein